MKVGFENLGALKSGEIEIADLTIICGENNTGKTYITYLVYCLLKKWKQFIKIDLFDAFKALQKLGIAKFDLQEEIVDQWPQLCEAALSKFKKAFPEMLASNSTVFNKLTLDFKVPLGSTWKEQEYQTELRSSVGTLILTITKPVDSTEVTLAAPAAESDKLRDLALLKFIEERVINIMLDAVIPSVFIVSTERTGAVIFRKQLNLAASNLVELLSQAHQEGADSIDPHQLFEKMYRNREYALPVKDNIKFINSLPDQNEPEGQLYKAFPDLLLRFEEIVGGKYMTTKEGTTNFQPLDSKIKLGLGEVSSSVRSLLIVWYWLKFSAKPGDMLMLDEPELNLHPANQRRLARFLVALINHGVKVFLTTHSDYIVKELNTLIMLNQNSPEMEKILKNPRLKDYTSEDKLDSTKVSLYMVDNINSKAKKQKKELKEANISPTLGIEALSFDKTIDDLNAVQEAIYYGLN